MLLCTWLHLESAADSIQYFLYFLFSSFCPNLLWNFCFSGFGQDTQYLQWNPLVVSLKRDLWDVTTLLCVRKTGKLNKQIKCAVTLKLYLTWRFSIVSNACVCCNTHKPWEERTSPLFLIQCHADWTPFLFKLILSPLTCPLLATGVFSSVAWVFQEPKAE